jgi:hypothetical protein
MRGSTAPDGAAIYNTSTGTLVMEDSVIWRSGNVDGQPIPVHGVVFSEGNLTIRNSTISGNKATETAGIWSAGTMSLDSVTVANNEITGGSNAVALVNSGPATIINSIFADSIGGADASCTVVPTGGYNLTETQQSGSACFTDGVNNDFVGQDPMLLPLGNNGGVGFTLTHALQVGSPAIDTGATGLTTDQRGHPRPPGAGDDRGAFEAAAKGILTVRKRATPADGRNFDFALSGGSLTSPITFQLDWGDDSDAVNSSETFVLDAGQYTVTEADSGRMGTRRISCSDANGPVGSFSGNTLTIDLQEAEDVDCTFFNEERFTVAATVSATGNGSGSVACSPAQVWKGETGTCTAVPDAGSLVMKWTGDCSGSGSAVECFLSKITKDQSSEVVFVNCSQICDLDKDSDVDSADLSRISRGRGRSVSRGADHSGDCDMDGRLSGNDVQACKLFLN